jgi:hypothetical protein
LLQADFFLHGKQSIQPEKQGDKSEPSIRRSERHEMFSKSGARIEPFGLNSTISSGFIVITYHITPLSLRASYGP